MFYHIASLTQYVDSLYEDYYNEYGRDYTLQYISPYDININDSYIITGDYVNKNIYGTLYMTLYFEYGGKDFGE